MQILNQLRGTARELLASGQVICVIGYEVGPRGRTRPAFVTEADKVDRLTWNQDCTHNLTTYLHDKLRKPEDRVAVIVKPCDSRAIHVLLAENKFQRQQVHLIGIMCDGIREGAGFSAAGDGDAPMQERCKRCAEREPVVYDTLIGEAGEAYVASATEHDARLALLETMPPEDRAEFWLSQFDRCIRCYACRQVCPMCDCPTCLYERDDSLWVGMGTGVSEKRTFHLGRAFHLAGRCIGCDECERVCPVDIPISLLNRRLAQEMEDRFGHRAGVAIAPSPITTILSGEG